MLWTDSSASGGDATCSLSLSWCIVTPGRCRKEIAQFNLGSDNCVVAYKGIIAGVSQMYWCWSWLLNMGGWEVINSVYIGSISHLFILMCYPQM